MGGESDVVIDFFDGGHEDEGAQTESEPGESATEEAAEVEKEVDPDSDDDEEDSPELKKLPPLTPEQQAAFEKAIGKKVSKIHEAQRLSLEQQQRADAAEASAKALAEKLQQYEAPVRPDIPAYPDPYDDDFEGKVRYRDSMIARAVHYDTQQQLQAQFQQQALEAQQQAQQEAVSLQATEYKKLASALGVNADELHVAGSKVGDILGEGLGLRILKDEIGPKITTYLGKHLDEARKMAEMDAVDAAVYLETVIKPKARKSGQKIPPEPSDSPGGAGVREGDRGPAGATYE